MRDALLARVMPILREEFLLRLSAESTAHVFCVDWVEATLREVCHALAEGMLEAWTTGLEFLALGLGSLCPSCGRPRKCKRRPKHPMTIQLLGLSVDIPKLYLECGHCEASGVSLTKLLTGLRHGDASGELKLIAAYLSAEHSYGKASRDLAVHHGQEVDRSQLRRMALEVEQEAMKFVETERRQWLAMAEKEPQAESVEMLMLQGDGGSVRTGVLVPCEPGDSGYGKTTPTGERPRRKRLSQNREVITLDVRQPCQSTSIGLDVVVPCRSAEGERARRMLALAMRKGLGPNTTMIGLGDMGSSLPTAFAEAFVGQETAFYSTDWKHICDYVRAAAAVLSGLDARRWSKDMREAIWDRDLLRRNQLLAQARRHRIETLPSNLAKCPLETLATYLSNNWAHRQAARLKDLGVDYVSARAESQVRDRTKGRFSVPGAWREENLEPKATLRSLIAEGRWDCFRKHYLDSRTAKYRRGLRERLELAHAQKRIVSIPSSAIPDEARAEAA